MAALTPGNHVGPYEILALLGAGGMGEVYRARDERIGREVAIKVLPAEFTSDPGRLQRFEQEARTAGALNHPNIVALYDVGTHDGAPYLVTELLEGQSLAQRIRSGDLTLSKAVELAVQIAAGLAAAHVKGIVHRDLKPENVFVTKDGHVKILDFGLAKLKQPERAGEEQALAETSPVVGTAPGLIMGTAPYMSPEQARGLSADARSDIFSFGCVLFEMLSGHRAFRGETAADVMAAILTKDPALLPASVPPALQGIVKRCLEKRPEDRFQSARDLASDLAVLARISETGTGPRPALARALRVPRPWLVGAAGVGLLAVVAALLVWAPWRRPAPAASFDPASVVVAVFENQTGDASLDKMGKQIADALTNDLLKTGELKVAVNPVAAGRPGEASGDPLLRLAQATRSVLVVAGTYDLRGDQLEVQARVVEPWQGKVVYTAAPVRCPRADPLAALEPLRQRVAGAVAWSFDKKLYPFRGKGRPTRYDALLEYRLGRANFNRDWDSARAHFEKAIALDPEFDLARLNVNWVLLNQGRLEEAGKELAAVETNLGRMVPEERLLVRICRANLEGRPLDALAALREGAALSGSPVNSQFEIGQAEIALNRPAEAIRALSSLPVDWDAAEYTVDYVPAALLAQAYHMDRDYEGQLKVAREGQRRFPGALNFYSLEASALAALGRLDEIEKVIQACQALQGEFRVQWPGRVMVEAAFELRAHGHREAARRMAERAVAWYRARPVTEVPPEEQEDLLPALWQSERWAEAKAMADTLLAKYPEDIGMRGVVGTLAARLGDVAQARRIEAELAAVTRPYLNGAHTFQRACIAAQLGEKDRALALLREAFAQGYEFRIEIHRDPDLEPLWGYPPYEELMKPKG